MTGRVKGTLPKSPEQKVTSKNQLTQASSLSYSSEALSQKIWWLLRTCSPTHIHSLQASKHPGTKLKAKPKQNNPVIIHSSTANHLNDFPPGYPSLTFKEWCFRHLNPDWIEEQMQIIFCMEKSNSFGMSTHECMEKENGKHGPERPRRYSQPSCTTQGEGQSSLLVLNPSRKAASSQFYTLQYEQLQIQQLHFPVLCSHLTAMMFSAPFQFSFTWKLQCWETADLFNIPT